MTYHLHTENLPNVPAIVARHFSGATITHGIGLWNATIEPAAIIEVSTDDYRAVSQLASDLLTTNRQEAVMIEPVSPGRASFITAADDPFYGCPDCARVNRWLHAGDSSPLPREVLA